MKGSDTKRGMLLPTRKGLAVEHRTNKACNMRKNAMPWAQWVEHLPPKYQARAERIWERRKCYQLSLMNIQ
jgi:hypothetical protein